MARILSASPLVAAERRVDEIFEEVGGENGGAIDQGPGRPGTRNASEHRLVLARDERPVDLGPSEAAAPAARHRDLRDFRVAPQTEERRGAQVRGDRLSSAGEARHHERPLRSRDGPGTDVDAAGRGALPHAVCKRASIRARVTLRSRAWRRAIAPCCRAVSLSAAHSADARSRRLERRPSFLGIVRDSILGSAMARQCAQGGGGSASEFFEGPRGSCRTRGSAAMRGTIAMRRSDGESYFIPSAAAFSSVWRETVLAWVSVNQMLPSGPAVMPWTWR
jgi:hypothetical protein